VVIYFRIFNHDGEKGEKGNDRLLMRLLRLCGEFPGICGSSLAQSLPREPVSGLLGMDPSHTIKFKEAVPKTEVPEQLQSLNYRARETTKKI
jgi:hypothetical protein